MTPTNPVNKNLQFAGLNPNDNPLSSVKEKSKAFDGKAEEKKPKLKTKIAEYGLANTTAHQIKRNHQDVGSPTSPDSKKSPKKPKGGERPLKK